MGSINRVKIGGTYYDLEDTFAREGIVLKKGIFIPVNDWKEIDSTEITQEEFEMIVNEGGKFMADVEIQGLSDAFSADIIPDTLGASILTRFNLSLDNKIRIYSEAKPQTAMELKVIRLIRG